jgi:RNA polymerase sigma-70 factor (ECF subfamily)
MDDPGPLPGAPLSTRTRELVTAVVARHQDYVRALAARLAPSAADGDDIAQETFLLLIRRGERFDLEREARPLLTAIVRNLAKQAWDRAMRENRRRRDDLAEYLEAVADRTEQRHESWPRAALEACLDKLSARERDLINLRYTADCRSEEIAQRLQSSADAVRMALVRLRERLRACIQRAEGSSI